MKTVKIIGAGMAGLLAGTYFRKRAKTEIYEKQSSLPSNHHAVLRFRSSAVSEFTGIEFRKINMIRTNIKHINDVADSLSYAYKCNGKYSSDRSINNGTVVGERYIAPPDFVSRMATDMPICYESNALGNMDQLLSYDSDEGGRPVIISTIPMPALMKALGYPRSVNFDQTNGSVIKAKIKSCDAFISIYDPRPTTVWSRLSITGNELAIEIPRLTAQQVIERYSSWDLATVIAEALSHAGISSTDHFLTMPIEGNSHVKDQAFAKILPIDEELRLSFIHWATDIMSVVLLDITLRKKRATRILVYFEHDESWRQLSFEEVFVEPIECLLQLLRKLNRWLVLVSLL